MRSSRFQRRTTSVPAPPPLLRNLPDKIAFHLPHPCNCGHIHSGWRLQVLLNADLFLLFGPAVNVTPLPARARAFKRTSAAHLKRTIVPALLFDPGKRLN
jgi:hypothetical protein